MQDKIIRKRTLADRFICGLNDVCYGIGEPIKLALVSRFNDSRIKFYNLPKRG